MMGRDLGQPSHQRSKARCGEHAKHHPWPPVGAQPKPTLLHLWIGHQMSPVSRNLRGCSSLLAGLHWWLCECCWNQSFLLCPESLQSLGVTHYISGRDSLHFKRRSEEDFKMACRSRWGQRRTLRDGKVLGGQRRWEKLPGGEQSAQWHGQGKPSECCGST